MLLALFFSVTGKEARRSLQEAAGKEWSQENIEHDVFTRFGKQSSYTEVSQTNSVF